MTQRIGFRYKISLMIITKGGYCDRIGTVTDAFGNVRKYTYNAGGKVTGLTDLDGKTVSFDYNDLGKISAYTDKEGYRAALGKHLGRVIGDIELMNKQAPHLFDMGQ